eukprot:1161259-Pelagomonas_calceolata.AAC.1
MAILEILKNNTIKADALKVASPLFLLELGDVDCLGRGKKKISRKTFNPMHMRTHLHVELIQAISNVLEHSLHPVHFYKVRAYSGIIGNEGPDACTRTAAFTNTTDIALPDARDHFHHFYWLTLQSSHGRNGEPHHSHTAPTHYLTNLTDEQKTNMHNRDKLGSANTSGYYYNSWQGLNHTIRPTPPNTTVNLKAHNPPSQLANK